MLDSLSAAEKLLPHVASVRPPAGSREEPGKKQVCRS